MTINAISIQLGLQKNEAIMFGYLASLYYYGKEWKGTMEKLGIQAKLGSKQTVSRTIEKLSQRGLISKCGLTIKLINQEVMALIGTKQVQSGTDGVQNGTEKFQNGTETQEKEKNQKNKEEIKDIIKENKSESNSTLALYKTILENGYLHPNMHLKNMNSYYNANGWKSNDKAAVLANWMRREQRFGHEPQMDEQAAEFICDLVDCLPAYQKTFCDALQAVKIEGNKALLYVPEARRDNLLNWMSTLDLDPLLRRYQMSIKINAAA